MILQIHDPQGKLSKTVHKLAGWKHPNLYLHHSTHNPSNTVPSGIISQSHPACSPANPSVRERRQQGKGKKAQQDGAGSARAHSRVRQGGRVGRRGALHPDRPKGARPNDPLRDAALQPRFSLDCRLRSLTPRENSALTCS